MLRAEWEAMTEEQQEAYTKQRVKELEEDRETKTIGVHTVAANAFQDTSQTIVKIENMVSNISSCRIYRSVHRRYVA